MKLANTSMAESVRHDRTGPVLCGIVLAGGEGRRLKPFVRQLRGDSLPKQYVKFSGARSMIEHTFRRAERLIPRERVFAVIDRSHLRFPGVIEQLRERHPGTVVIQPDNKDTGPGVLLPLAHIQKRYPNAVVALFPSDQYVRDEDTLMRHIRLAHVIVKRGHSPLVLLGISPEYEESEYGYILPQSTRDMSGWGIYNVGEFFEKPGATLARELIARGALWNTMMMVFNAGAMFQWVQELKPEFHSRFERIRAAIGNPLEPLILREEYNGLETINFSKDFLEPLARRLEGVTVLPVGHVGWSDWGSERRIVETLARMGRAIPPPASPLRNGHLPRLPKRPAANLRR
jgi:mannose-1-phosphate guanylyltransferase